jgi:tetratricopeptide (TPR) repeat protein
VSEETATQLEPAGIRAFDQTGKEVIVPREEWATQVLPNMVKEAWDSPDQLYIILVNSLNAGFFAEMADSAKRLYEIDTVPARGASLWGIVLMQQGRIDEAESVLEGYVADKGEEASVLVNLAKVYAAKGDNERAQSTLWRSLELDPNLDVALAWFATTAQESGGDAAAKAALERLRAMPASWRAQLWLARAELDANNLPAAKVLYVEALERAPRPVPPDFLMQMSGDLGGHGHVRELLELTEPQFVPEVHGLPVGNNLMKASFELGDLDATEAIRQTLIPFNRPDWRGALAYWAAEIAKRRGVAGEAQQLQIGMLRVDGPVWLPQGSRARVVFGWKAADAPTVTFLGGSAEAPEEAGPELAVALARMTRSLPLYLAEQAEMRTAVAGRAMLPWAVGASGGFVVSGARWPDATAVQAVTEPSNQSDYVVTVHIDAEVEPWTAMLAFLRSSDGARIGEIDVEFDSTAPEAELPRLADEVVELLSAFGPTQSPAEYQVPAGEAFRSYLVRLEQLLAVRCATMDAIPAQFLSNERQILEGDFALCESEPESMPARLLLLETLGALERVRPEVAAEFRDRFMEMVRSHPLPLLDAAFSPPVNV